jgi:hypothetical protein
VARRRGFNRVTFSRIRSSWEPERREKRFLGYSRYTGRGKGRCRVRVPLKITGIDNRVLS